MARKNSKSLRLRDVLDWDILRQRLERAKRRIDFEHYVFLKFLLYTGARISEALNVRVKDLQWGDARRYTMCRIRQLKKRGERYRLVVIHPDLERDLREYIRRRRLGRSDLLFPWTRQWGYKICRRVLGCRPHALRHALAIKLLRETRDLDLVRRQLGHSGYDVLKVYLDYSLADRASEIVEALS